MKTRVFLFIVLSLAIFGSGLHAEETSESELCRGLGIAGGILSGNGFSYRYSPVCGMGYNIAGIYLLGEDYSYFKLGLESLLILHNDQYAALYFITGFSYLESWNDDEVWMYDGSSSYYKTDRDWETGFAGGVGLGLTLKTKRIWTSLECIMCAYHKTFLPYPQVTVHYMLW